MRRDPRYEREFLENVEREAARRFGIHSAGYSVSVAARLAIGAERYGDLDFAAKDCVRELLEETPDVAAYALLEAQKRLSQDFADDSAFHLFEASIHAAAADWHVRQARTSD